MQVYIYTLSDPITQEIRYVGKSVNPKKRIDSHLHTRNKSHCSSWIQSLKRMGLKPVFEIIDIVNKENWIFWEQWWIFQIKAWQFNLTNHTIGGEGHSGTKQSAESNKKRSISLKGRKFGTYSKERKLAISNAMKGRKAWNKGKSGIYSEETIKKMKGRDLKGSKNPCSKLTDLQIIDIRTRWLSGERQKHLAGEFGISCGTLNRIVLRKTYSHL